MGRLFCNKGQFVAAAEFFNGRFAATGGGAVGVLLKPAQRQRWAAVKKARPFFAGAVLCPTPLHIGGNAGIEMAFLIFDDISKPHVVIIRYLTQRVY